MPPLPGPGDDPSTAFDTNSAGQAIELGSVDTGKSPDYYETSSLMIHCNTNRLPRRASDDSLVAPDSPPMKEPAAQELPLKPDDGIDLPPPHPVQAAKDTHGIYQRSPFLMVFSWVFGLALSLGHHWFYVYFDGRIVESNDEQQWNIRVGSMFALAVKTLLTGSVFFSYTQWLWRTLKRKGVSLKTLDNAFSVETTILSLLNRELLLKIPVGFILAVIAWSEQIPSLITPATLVVVASFSNFPHLTSVLSLDFTNATTSNNFAYFIPYNDTERSASVNKDSQVFDGPRSILTRLSTAPDSLGQTLPISPPFNDCSYALNFFAPYVSCTEANATVEYIVEAFLQETNNTWKSNGMEFSEAYYAFVPSHEANIDNATTILYNGTNYTALVQPRRQQQPINATNELWMKFYRYSKDASGHHVMDSNGRPVAVPKYSVCRLWNASYEIELSFVNGSQTVLDKGVSLLNPVDYPVSDPEEPSDLVQMAYTSLFIVISDQLVGMMGIVINSTTSTPQYGSMNTDLEHSSLIGSDDLDYFFDLNHLVTKSNWTSLSPQRLLDKALAQNQTLPFLVQQLSFNVTVSLMNDPLLASPTIVNVSETIPVNRYSYDVRSLWLAYGIGNFFALCAIILGLIAFKTNNASHDNAFSTLVSICRDPSLSPLFPPCCHGKLPLPEETMKAQLWVVKNDDVENLRPVEEMTIPSCRLCAAGARGDSVVSRWTKGSIFAGPNGRSGTSV